MVRSVPQSSRSTPTDSKHASSMPPSTPLPERSTYTFDAVRSAASECCQSPPPPMCARDRKSTRLNSSHSQISYAVFCLKKKKQKKNKCSYSRNDEAHVTRAT